VKITKGIVLAGGSGSRLYPLTVAFNKQLIPIYDKPMIYYPISILLMSGIREILIVSTPDDLPLFKKLLGDGSLWGCRFSYIEQPHPRGLPEAFILGETFIGKDSVALILGDNILYGTDLQKKLEESLSPEGAIVFAYQVADPHRYGVVEFDAEFNVISLEEKPNKPKSNFVLPGIYFFNNEVVEISKKVVPSGRGELEITDVIRNYLVRKKLKVTIFGRGTAWLDTGTNESLVQASQFVQVLEQRQGLKVCCPEEIAFRKGFIDEEKLRISAKKFGKSDYGKFLLKLLENPR